MKPVQFKNARMTLGLSQNAMADTLGLKTSRAIRQFESGEREVSGPVAKLTTLLLEQHKEEGSEMNTEEKSRYRDVNHYALASEIHADNVAAGWWTDLATGKSIIETRNRPEMLMLTVSEVSEAADAWSADAMDDKLPHHLGFVVELADTAIRIYDQLGAVDMGGMDQEQFDSAVTTAYMGTIRVATLYGQLMGIVNYLSAAMEGTRKGNTRYYVTNLIQALANIYQVAGDFSRLDLTTIIAEKRAFNANRADHKVANRLLAGGKAF